LNATEIRALTEGQIDEELERARQELFNLRFQKVTGRLADASRVKVVRRELARLLTVRREREIWAAYAATQEKED